MSRPKATWLDTMKEVQMNIINIAGISVMTKSFFFSARYTVMLHSVNTLSVWLAHPKYFHIVLKLSGLSICHTSSMNVTRNMGRLIASRLAIGFWFMFSASAIISLLERNAVSPLVIGAATTPSIASMPPVTPSQPLHTSITICGAVSPAGGNFEEPVTQATLKVVGTLLALSSERAHARRYPSIHPLDSWSKYNSIVAKEKIDAARQMLRAGNDVNQMMKVVGEEGTPTSDFVTYLKSEFIDSVYLQQNTFDPVDSACGSKRQEYVFDKILSVIGKTFSFPDKNAARTFFQNLRQAFIDWNYIAWDTDDFKAQEAKIDELLATA